MIHLEPLAQSRQMQLEIIQTPIKEEAKVHRLGGLSRAQSLKEPVKVVWQHSRPTIASQQVVFTFSNSNPLYHMHKAMHHQPAKTDPEQKCFRDVIREVHEMKEICQKLLTPQKEQQQQEYHKTLIMDLQKLQTNRADLEMAQSQLNESQISIKGQLTEDSRSCFHGNCDEVNGVLQKALVRLEELERGNERLEKVLAEERIGKQVVESENSYLREQIARIDGQKCEEIKKLRQQLEKMKRQQKNSLSYVPVYELGRVPIENISQKSIKQESIKEESMKPVQPKQRPVLAQIELSSNLKESILISVPEQRQQIPQQKSMRKLKHVVYL